MQCFTLFRETLIIVSNTEHVPYKWAIFVKNTSVSTFFQIHSFKHFNSHGNHRKLVRLFSHSSKFSGLGLGVFYFILFFKLWL